MRKFLFLFYMLTGLAATAQVDSARTSSSLMNELDNKTGKSNEKVPAKVFLSQRLINANTTEMLQKGFLEFKVVHNFGDMGGTFGGKETFYGLDGATDIKIGFTYGVSKNFNIAVARYKGFDGLHKVTRLFELALKYRFMQQMENDRSRPLSIAMYVNGVSSGAHHTQDTSKEHSFSKASDRQSQLIQLLIARKFGKILSFQLNPTYVHTNYVLKGDVKSLFAMGAAIRVPIYKKFVFIADWFHTFRSEENKRSLEARGIKLYDAVGVGLELVTPGHIFHINFTNPHNILENRFLARTTTAWGRGEYRWGFTVARNFVIVRDKKKK